MTAMEQTMFMKKIAVPFLLALLVAGLGASSAGAMGWRANHPRRAEVNSRLNHQDHRINVEHREGEITAAQAASAACLVHGLASASSGAA